MGFQIEKFRVQSKQEWFSVRFLFEFKLSAWILVTAELPWYLISAACITDKEKLKIGNNFIGLLIWGIPKQGITLAKPGTAASSALH